MLIIFWLSHEPVLPTPPGGLTDKQAHALVYGALAALWVRALSRARLDAVTLVRAVIAIAASGLYGVTDEWHQSFVPGRTSDVADLAADLVGAVCAAAL